MSAYKVNDGIMLVFTKILDELPLGLIDEDEEKAEVTDRNYWLSRGTPETVKMADELISMVKTFATGIEPKYTKFYIGLTKDGQPYNFTSFIP